MRFVFFVLFLLLTEAQEMCAIVASPSSAYNLSICFPCDEYYRQTDWPKGDTLDSPIAGVTSADECCSKCEDKGVDGPSVPAVHLDIHVPLNCPECKAFVFLEPDGGCWHKRQLKDPEHCPSCSSKNFLEEQLEEKYSPMYGMDRFGGDIRQVEGIGSPNECGKLCEDRPDCRAFVWRRDFHHCWLKNELNELNGCLPCVLGYRPL